MKHLFRTTSFIWASGLIATIVAPQVFAADSEKPNILFIFTDDQSFRTVSSYEDSYEWVHTPNIDRLADTGVRFEYAYVSSWCMPARATMLTGLQQHNVPSLRMEGPYPGSEYEPSELEFWPKTFRANGYSTGHIGKWHTGSDTGYGRDWDYQYAWIRPSPSPGNEREYYVDQMILENGKEIGPVDAYATDNYTDRAIEFIQGQHRDETKPWYLWLSYTGTHGPFTPADRHLEEYEGVAIPEPRDLYPPRPGKPDYVDMSEHYRRDESGTPRFVQPNGSLGATLYNGTRQYHQTAISIDENVGRLIRVLKSTGQLENTLVVFTSDQGFAWGQHGFRTKFAPYSASLRVPFIVSMPGKLPQGIVSRSPVGGIDLVPTFFDYAGIDLPWKMDGRNMRDLLERPEQRWDRPVFLTYTGTSYRPENEYFPSTTELPGPFWYGFIIKDRLKYIQTFIEDEIPELYHIDNDPDELHNLALLPQYRQTVIEYQQALVSELERTDAKFVDELPSVRGF